MDNDHTISEKIFSFLNITNPTLLGEGAETLTYKYTDNKVIKIHKYSSSDEAQTAQYLEKMRKLYAKLNSYQFPFSFPEIYEVHSLESYFFTVERELTGTPIATIYEQLIEADRQTFLMHFFGVLDYFQTITFDSIEYGQIFDAFPEVRSDNWILFIREMVTRKLVNSRNDLQEDGLDVDKIIKLFEEDINELPPYPDKRFVHGDYFLGNILVNEKLEITAVLDVGPSSAIGDSRVDLAGAIAFLDIYSFFSPDDREFLTALAVKKYGEEVVKAINTYTIYYSLLFSDCKTSDPTTYNWSLKNLKPYAAK